MNAKQVFKAGSKSFSLAAMLFNRKMYNSTVSIYAWCRYCDDYIDGGSQLHEDLLKRVQELESRTLSALNGETQTDPIFAGFQKVVLQYEIPAQYPLDLIKGLEMDARKTRYANLAELEVYAYRVAGTVGLMMAKIMGARDERALDHAKQMGIAMQLTNISRDIIEDAKLGRVYLPYEWLAMEGLSPGDILNPSEISKVALVARKLVVHADVYYRNGELGLKYLERRPALAVAAASRIYRAIGHLVKKKGTSAWKQRTVVPFFEKMRHVAGAIWHVWRFT